MKSSTLGSPLLSGCIIFIPGVFTLPLPFSTGLETFSQLVWKSAEGTVSMDKALGFPPKSTCLALDRVLMAPDLFGDSVMWFPLGHLVIISMLHCFEENKAASFRKI